MASETHEVFISYTHEDEEHNTQVFELATKLRAMGVDAWCDRWETNPIEGWPRWMNNQVSNAKHVLLVCSETFKRRFEGNEEVGKGLGAQWESTAITLELYRAGGENKKFLPIVLGIKNIDFIPSPLGGHTHYRLFDLDGYELLYRRLTNQPLHVPPMIGSRVEMLPLSGGLTVKTSDDLSVKPETKSFDTNQYGYTNSTGEEVFNSAKRFFESRIYSAFSGIRGFRWISDRNLFEDALLRLMRLPLTKEGKHHDGTKATFQPIWWTRGSSDCPIMKFSRFENKLVMDSKELKVSKIAINVGSDRQCFVIYVECEPDKQSGIYGFTSEEIGKKVNYREYFSEEFAILDDLIITRAEYDDGGAWRDSKYIDTRDSILRTRFLSRYNFLITYKNSAFHHRETRDYIEEQLNRVLLGEPAEIIIPQMIQTVEAMHLQIDEDWL